MMMRVCAVFFIVCSCLTVLALGGNVEFKKCPPGKAGTDDSIVKAIRVSKCTTPPCVLKKEESYNFEIDFVPNKSSSKVDVAAYGVFSDLEMPWPGVKTNVCVNKNFNINCPVSAGTKVTYKNNVLVLPIYPTAKLSVHWKIKLDDVIVSCSLIDVKIIA